MKMQPTVQGFQFRPANGEFRQTFSFNPTQIRQNFYV
jgi:sporulation-control protein spo0M